MDELARALYDAGFRGNDLLNMLAVSMAENGGRLSDLITGAGIGTAGEVGPLQIHPVHFGDISPDVANTYEGSARYAAKLVYDTPQGFKHWSAYAGGQYKSYLQEAAAAMRTLPEDATRPQSLQRTGRSAETASASTPPTGVINDAIPGTLARLGSIADKLDDTMLSGVWWRKASVTMGAFVLIGTGAALWAFSRPATQNAIKAATRVG